MSLSDILPTLTHQEFMLPLPELNRPAEHCNKVSCYETVRHPVRPVGLIMVMEGDPNLLGRQTSDVPPRDLVLILEEYIPKI